MSDELTAYLDQIGERCEAYVDYGHYPKARRIIVDDLPRLLRIARAAVELSEYGSPVEERTRWRALYEAIQATEKELSDAE